MIKRFKKQYDVNQIIDTLYEVKNNLIKSIELIDKEVKELE